MVGALGLLIGCVQAVALAATIGGTLLVWLRARGGHGREPAELRLLLLRLAEKYERWYWLALGLLLLARFASLATLGDSAPAAAAGWGVFLGLLLGVLVFFALAMLRTLLLIQLSLAGDGASPRLLRVFPWVYGGTGLALVALVLLALVWARNLLAGPGA